MADSAVNLVVRAHCKPEHDIDVFFGISEQMKIELDSNNITIPFPQRDGNVFKS